MPTHSQPLSRWQKLQALWNPVHYATPQDDTTSPRTVQTTRQYSRHRQRVKLFLNSTSQFLITALLCGLSALVLREYSRPEYITNINVRVFNALITALQIGIGINVTSSLRSYAKLLRWPILASSYRPLREFDLILSCSEQTNVLKLLFHSRKQHCWLLPTWTQIVCLSWIFINLAGSIGIALLGLTYSLEQSPTAVATRPGNVSVLDLSQDWMQGAANSFGQNYLSVYEPVTIGFGRLATALPGQIFTCSGVNYCNGTWGYGFQDANPQAQNGTAARQSLSFFSPSGRFVKAQATCRKATITSDSGEDGTITFLYQGSLYRYLPDVQTGQESGQMTYTFLDTCDGQCAVILAYQNCDECEPDISAVNQLFICNNTISAVQNISAYTLAAGRQYAEPFQFGDGNDNNGQWLAAAIATGNAQKNSLGPFTTYSQGNAWSVRGNLSIDDGVDDATLIASLIAEFPMAALAVADLTVGNSNAPRVNVPGMQPYIPSHLNVSWRYALILLIVVPVLQLVTLSAVVAFADTAIVKDDSNLSIAKLLSPVTEKLGDRGCLMTGDEIVRLLEVEQSGGEDRSQVAYNFSGKRRLSATNEKEVMHVGVFDKHRGLTLEKRFPEGLYDGRH